MNKRGGHGYGSMTDRIAATSRTTPPAAAGPVPPSAATAATDPRPDALKHCWVSSAHGQLPGLLLEWRRVASGWQGRVVHPVPDADGWMLVEEWLPASDLTASTG